MKLNVGSYVLTFDFSIEKKKKRRSGPRPGARCVHAIAIVGTEPPVYKCTACGEEGVPKRGHTKKKCPKSPPTTFLPPIDVRDE